LYKYSKKRSWLIMLKQITIELTPTQYSIAAELAKKENLSVQDSIKYIFLREARKQASENLKKILDYSHEISEPDEQFGSELDVVRTVNKIKYGENYDYEKEFGDSYNS
jgi:hypothetical protein